MYGLCMHLFAYWDKLQTILQSFCLLKKEPGAKDWGLTPLHWEKGRTSCACAVNNVSQDELRSRHTEEVWRVCPLATGRTHFHNHSTKNNCLIIFVMYRIRIFIWMNMWLSPPRRLCDSWLSVCLSVNQITKSQKRILMIFFPPQTALPRCFPFS